MNDQEFYTDMDNVNDILSDYEIRCYEAMPVPLCIFQKEDGIFRLVLVSDGMCSLLGIQREEMILHWGENIYYYIHPDDRQIMDASMTYARLHPQNDISSIFRISTGEHEYIWVVCNGSELKKENGKELLFLNFSNVTDQKLISLSIKEEKRKNDLLMEKILSTTKTAIFWKDADRRFVGVNQAFLDYYGFPDENMLIGKTDEDIGWHTDPDPYKNDEIQIIQNGTSTYRVHGKCMARGENRDIVASKSPLYIDGKIAGLVGSFEDVTTEYRQREQIEKLNEDLKAKLREEEILKKKAESANEAKSHFFSNMSHDIRTPMNAIVGLTAIARQHLNEPRKMEDYLDKISSSSKVLLSLINDVLDMSAIENGKMKISSDPFDMKSVLNGISSVYFTRCEAKGVDFSLAANLVHESYIGDSLRINQILLNLISNAYKFTGAGGSIHVVITQISEEKDTALLRFQVSDTGCGMGEDMLRRLYGRFEQESQGTAREHGGSGLGLSITKDLIELMGGSIEVKSAPGRGTEFTVELPMKVSEKKTFRVNNKFRILAVDDEQDELEYAGMIFGRLGMNYDLAHDGEEAIACLERARSEGVMYDLCFLDWKMPGMSGIDTAKKIRSEFSTDMPLVVISAYDVAQIEDEAKNAGITRFISKPLFQSTVYNIIAELLLKTDPKQRPGESRNFDFSGKKVLVADDNKLNREVAEGLLGFVNIQADFAEDGEKAVEEFKNKPEGTYLAILMDVQMPVMDGYEATRTIRKLARKDAKLIPIFAMTADAFESDVRKAKENGMNGHIPKPISPQILYECLQNIVDG